MITGIKKDHKTTEIYTDEADKLYHIRTYNTDLKKRLSAYAVKYPQLCRKVDDDGCGGLAFEIDKHRFSFRLTVPYTTIMSFIRVSHEKKCELIISISSALICVDVSLSQQKNRLTLRNILS